MNLTIKIADCKQLSEILLFQQKYLLPDNENIYSNEFLCPKGMAAAIRKKEVIIAENGDNIIAIIRFYKRKIINKISLYQFVILPEYRRKGLLVKMLKLINNTDVISYCPKYLSFNKYYEKTGWILDGCDEKFNHWIYRKK